MAGERRKTVGHGALAGRAFSRAAAGLVSEPLATGPTTTGRLPLRRGERAVGPLVAVGARALRDRAPGGPLQDVLTALRLKTSVSRRRAARTAGPNGERHLRTRLRLARLYPPALL